MRIWSLHPHYLDTKGLIALWREALLAKHVLEGNTKGYKSHPQLERFKSMPDPVSCINQYLMAVSDEAQNRGYNFDQTKIGPVTSPTKILVTKGQIEYEMAHLLNKLSQRNPGKYATLTTPSALMPHPIFNIVEGNIESWEKNLYKKR